mmetsp:Transcript_86532/g.173144  ORF Transcript_86532/g.173144 Transcript_86532/m.173144 type:complete len:135 (-) Transcript_86532:1794-2198(-)
MPPIPFASVRSDSRDVLFWPPSGDVTMPPSGKVDIDFCESSRADSVEDLLKPPEEGGGGIARERLALLQPLPPMPVSGGFSAEDFTASALVAGEGDIILSKLCVVGEKENASLAPEESMISFGDIKTLVLATFD